MMASQDVMRYTQVNEDRFDFNIQTMCCDFYNVGK
jgi:hypothetical protein